MTDQEYKRIRSILKRKNEPILVKTTQPVSGFWGTEIGRLDTWGPNMGGNFICWTQYFMYI